MTGAFVITLALLSYGIGSISLQRFKMISPGVLIFLTVGLALDVTANVLIYCGYRLPFTVKSILAYSAFIIMLINVIWIWRVYLMKNINAVAGKQLLLFSKIAFGWWLVVYVAVSLVTIWK